VSRQVHVAPQRSSGARIWKVYVNVAALYGEDTPSLMGKILQTRIVMAGLCKLIPPAAFGKTVTATAMIARRGVSNRELGW